LRGQFRLVVYGRSEATSIAVALYHVPATETKRERRARSGLDARELANAAPDWVTKISEHRVRAA